MNKLWIVFLGVIVAAFWSFRPINESKVMQDFMYGTNRMESQLTIPLERAGSKILPFVLEAVQDREMQRRRYAIGFLGAETYEPALLVLQKILEDETEIWYFRADALEAIYSIDKDRAFRLSKSYIGERDWLGRYARNIRDGKPLLTFE